MKKVTVVLSARASYSRVKSVLTELQKKKNIFLDIVATSSLLTEREGNTVNFIVKDGFKISQRIYNLTTNDNLTYQAKSTGIAIIELSNYFINHPPDIVIIIADRFETISASIASSYMNIPTVHLQGGEETGNIDNKVRNANTKLCDYHFVSTVNAKKLIEMGESNSRVFNYGCPSIDLAKESLKVKYTPSIIEKYKGVGQLSDKENFLVVLFHPVTNEYLDSRKQVKSLFNALRNFKIQIIWLWPNVDLGNDKISKEIRALRENQKPNNIYFVKHFDSKDFLVILRKAKLLIGNSSVGIRECSYIGTPVVNIGTRQQNREKAENVINCLPDKDKIIECIKIQLKKGIYNCSKLYGDGNSGIKIANEILKIQPSIKI